MIDSHTLASGLDGRFLIPTTGRLLLLVLVALRYPAGQSLLLGLRLEPPREVQQIVRVEIYGDKFPLQLQVLNEPIAKVSWKLAE